MDGYCYKCTGYGDDYYYDKDLDEFIYTYNNYPYNNNN